eukprot:Gregarina_sp_Poly_1__1743@NODE_144_length_12899_cov_53_943501_g129_i0_p1_GENE_NODE_144_length_12899_cov_53_943501_g129_i0NODE_144_length_12899_cov_53_943501_g129_i0_p1_ORF_typecomplete_len2053_score348_41Kinesin/PF00225_23/5_3e98Kinesin/PF00225_23/2_5e02Kinesin/PF00225_23/1_8e04Microtub_bd/PF16796_5/2_5e13WD40/PF00400_32/1e02WD40/PF00400_32/4_6WD40/PF00400_32/3_1e03WD40/PF00400_32/4_4e03WD40/PF00400_32/9_9ANAPC4_WD40/PF12894_7/1_5e04ANAPC4_WD40/PF12894_7/3e02ANAPC4_WD40/PF12894_7/1_8e02ANAPC4_WD
MGLLSPLGHRQQRNETTTDGHDKPSMGLDVEAVAPGLETTGSSSRCKVIIKVKPGLNEKGQRCGVLENEEKCIRWDNGRPDDLTPPLRRLLFQDMDRAYIFDLLLPPQVSQKESYSAICDGLLESFMAGFNCCLLAYGQTGAGKTYTMGTAQPQGGASKPRKEDRGIVPRALTDLFQMVEEKRKAGWKINLCVSYIELYNEEIRDLLDRGGASTAAPTRPAAHMAKPLGASSLGQGLFPSSFHASVPLSRHGIKITHDKITNQIVLQGVKTVSIDSETAALDCLTSGGLYRTTGSNNLNLTSSRSHAIYTINAVQTEVLKEYGEGATITSKFHFVDLAGSERVKRTQAQGHRLREGININSGLLALSNVINALTEERFCSTDIAQHVPYRDSKLTRILQDSLGGNSKTVMVACVSASKSDFAESFSTIKYASRARNIQNTPVLNKDPQSVLIASLKQRLVDLEDQLKEYRRRSPSVLNLDYQEGQTTAANVIFDLEREIADLREVIKVRESREAEERARRIAVEAKLLRYKEKYHAFLKEVKAHATATNLDFMSDSTRHEIDHLSDMSPLVNGMVSDDGEEPPRSTHEALARNSELETEIDMLRKETLMLQRSLEQQKKLLFLGKATPEERIRQISNLLQTLSERYAQRQRKESTNTLPALLETSQELEDSVSSAIRSSDDVAGSAELQSSIQRAVSVAEQVEGKLPSLARLSSTLHEDLFESEPLANILRVATEEEQSTLLSLMEALSENAEDTENLKTKSERLTMSMKRTEDLLTIKEREARHWEQMASHLSVELQIVKQQLTDTQTIQSSLQDQVEAAEEREKTTESIMQTPMRKVSQTPRTVQVPESVRLQQKLHEEAEYSRNYQEQLKRVEHKFELAQKKRTESRTEAAHYESSLQQMRVEKAQIMKKQAEQERKHRQILAEKDKMINRLESEARRHGEEKWKTEQKIALLTKKNEKLSTKNLELFKEKEGLSKRVLSLQLQNRIGRQGSTNVPSSSSLKETNVPVQSRASSAKQHEIRASKKPGAAQVNQEILDEAREVLNKYVSMRLEKDLEEQRLERKARRVRKLTSEIERLQNRVHMMEAQAAQSNAKRKQAILRQLTDFNDKIEAWRNEREIYEHEIENLKNQQEGSQSPTEVEVQTGKAFSEVKSGMRNAPDIYLEGFVQMYALITHHLEHTRRDLRKRDQELQDVRKMYANAQLRMEGIINNHARERLEVLYEANTDKLAFIEAAAGVDQVAASVRDRNSASSSEDRDADALPSPTPLSEKTIEGMHTRALKEKVYILLNEKYEAQKKIEILQKNLDMLQADKEPIVASNSHGLSAPFRSSTTESPDTNLGSTGGAVFTRQQFDHKRVMLISNEQSKERKNGRGLGSRGHDDLHRRAYSSTPSTRTNTFPSPLRSPKKTTQLGVPIPTLQLQHARSGDMRNIKTARAEVRGSISKSHAEVSRTRLSKQYNLTAEGEQESNSRNAYFEELSVRSPANVRRKPLGTGAPMRIRNEGAITRLKSFDEPPSSSRRQSNSQMTFGIKRAIRQPNGELRESIISTSTAEIFVSRGGIVPSGASSAVNNTDPGYISSPAPVIIKPRRQLKAAPAKRRIDLVAVIPDAHGDYIKSCAFASDKARLRPTKFVTGSMCELKAFDLYRLDAASGAVCFSWRGNNLSSSADQTACFVNSIDTLEENVLIAAVGTTVKIFDIRESRPVHSWVFAPPSDVGEGSLPMVNAVTVMRSSLGDQAQYVAASGTDCTIRIFDTRNLGVLPLCKIPTRDEEYSVAYLPRLSKAVHDKRQTREQNAINGIVCGGESGSVRLFARGFTQLPSLHNLGVVRSLRTTQLSPTEYRSPLTVLFCCSDRDDRLRLWVWDEPALRSSDLGDRRPPVIVGSRYSDHDYLFAPGDNALPSSSSSSGDEDHWTLSNYGPSGKSLAAVTVLENTCEAISGDKKGRLQLWRLNSEEVVDRSPLLQEPGHLRARLRSASLSPQDRIREPSFLEAPRSLSLSQQLLTTQVTHVAQRPVNELQSFSEDWNHQFVFSVADDTNIKIWNVVPVSNE